MANCQKSSKKNVFFEAPKQHNKSWRIEVWRNKQYTRQQQSQSQLCFLSLSLRKSPFCFDFYPRSIVTHFAAKDILSFPCVAVFSMVYFFKFYLCVKKLYKFLNSCFCFVLHILNCIIQLYVSVCVIFCCNFSWMRIVLLLFT